MINFDMIGRNETPGEQTKGLIDIAPGTSNEVNLVGTKCSPVYRRVVEELNRIIGLRLNYKWDDQAALNVFFRSDQFASRCTTCRRYGGSRASIPIITRQRTRWTGSIEKMEKIVRLACCDNLGSIGAVLRHATL